jgi:hypothetical protein
VSLTQIRTTTSTTTDGRTSALSTLELLVDMEFPRACMEPLLDVFFLLDSVLMDLYPACAEMYSD